MNLTVYISFLIIFCVYYNAFIIVLGEEEYEGEYDALKYLFKSIVIYLLLNRVDNLINCKIVLISLIFIMINFKNSEFIIFLLLYYYGKNQGMNYTYWEPDWY